MDKAAVSLERAVRRALCSVPHLDGTEASEIFVKAYGGKVILAGIVSTDEARDVALRAASEVPGVLRLRNKLRTDTELTQAVRDRLRAYPVTASVSIEPMVFRGVAELRGRAPYDAQLAAIKIARAIAGIRDVVNEMELSTMGT
jgi:osmotically-inducible protein OsmY